MLVDFRACKAGTQKLMQEEQALEPAADLIEAWLNGWGCGMLNGLHVNLLPERDCNRERLRLLACHMREHCVKRYPSPGKIPGRIPRKRAFFGGFFLEGSVSGKIPGKKSSL
jgi:hypothetical protein